MDDKFYKGIRYSRLKEQDEHMCSSHTNGKLKLNSPATQDIDLYPDSDLKSDVFKGNGNIAQKACSDRVNGLETLYEDHDVDGNRTLEVPEGESEIYKDGNSGGQTSEHKFSLKRLTKDQIVILASTSFTNMLSYLSLSILAPFFPKEVRVMTLIFIL